MHHTSAFTTLIQACDTISAWQSLQHSGRSVVTTGIATYVDNTGTATYVDNTGTADYLLPLLADSVLVLLSQTYFQVCTMLLQDSHPPRCSLL